MKKAKLFPTKHIPRCTAFDGRTATCRIWRTCRGPMTLPRGSTRPSTANIGGGRSPQRHRTCVQMRRGLLSVSDLPRAINFLTKPPHEPGDKPLFDKGRFTNTTPVVGKFNPKQDDENEFDAVRLLKPSDTTGVALFATWQGGNKANPSEKVARSAKSYEELADAAYRPLLPHVSWQSYKKSNPTADWESWREFVSERYVARWPRVLQSYGDIRQHGKFRRSIDVTYAEASRREREAFLYDAIDKAAPTRRRQVMRQRDTRLWQLERCRHQPRRLLYLLKQPRTIIEVRFLMEALGWCLTQKLSGTPQLDHSFEKGNAPINLVSDEAVERSKENDGRSPQLRRHVFLSASDELDLARRAKAGDPIARDRLLAVHWPLVHGIAKKHVTASHPLVDLIQEGFIGLTKSFDKFDPEAGFRFSTFAMLPIEWAIQDYKRHAQKKDPPLDGAMIENTVDIGSWTSYHEATPTRTSRIIGDCVERMTVHISPYENGLALETHDLIAELNAEAAEKKIKVNYVGLANKIEIAGDIQGAADSDTLGGWLVRHAHEVGYFDGEEGVLRKGNSQWRKHLRKNAKRKSPDTF